LALVRSRCQVALPSESADFKIAKAHDVSIVKGTDAVLNLLAEREINVTTMGRSVSDDRVFFEAAAAAGLLAADIAMSLATVSGP
jgi:hypothetical protein